MPTPPGSPHDRGTEARDAVAAVLHDQAERARKRTEAEPRPPRDRRPLLLAVAAVLVGLVVGLAVAPPAALLPAPFPEPEPPMVEAGLRMDVFVGATAVARFQQARGRLPESLLEAMEDADDTDGLEYQRLPGGGWTLTGRRDGFEVRYRSGTDRNALLDPARARLDGGSP